MNRFSRTWAICCIGLVSIILGELFLPNPAKLWCGDVYLVSFSSWCLFRGIRDVFPKLARWWFLLVVTIVSVIVIAFTFSTGVVQSVSFALFFSLVIVSAIFQVVSTLIIQSSWWFTLHGYTGAWRCFRSSVQAIDATNKWCPEDGYLDPEAATSIYFGNNLEAVENTLTNCYPHATARQREAFYCGWNAYLTAREHRFARFLREPWIIGSLVCIIGTVTVEIVLACLR